MQYMHPGNLTMVNTNNIKCKFKANNEIYCIGKLYNKV